MIKGAQLNGDTAKSASLVGACYHKLNLLIADQAILNIVSIVSTAFHT